MIPLGIPDPESAALHQKVVIISKAQLHNIVSLRVHTKHTKNQTTNNPAAFRAR